MKSEYVLMIIGLCILVLTFIWFVIDPVMPLGLKGVIGLVGFFLILTATWILAFKSSTQQWSHTKSIEQRLDIIEKKLKIK